MPPKGVPGKDIFRGDKIYIHTTDMISRDMRPRMEGKLKVFRDKKEEQVLYSNAVSKHRTGGLNQRQEVMEGRFVHVSEGGVR